ncbi:MAG: alpha-hydroxy-acid oxidizing protein [Haloferacaceae archaeon]
MADTDSFVTRRAREIKESGPGVPLDYEELKREAANHLSSNAYDYVAGGAGTEGTVSANQVAFDRYRIVPRVFRDIDERDLSTTLFGADLAAPLGIAPVGGHGVFDPEGELASARAAAELGVPFSLSTGASRSMEDVAEAMDEVRAGAPRFFQLYWPREWEVAASLVRRAEAADYDAVVLTLDSQLTKWRRRNLRNDYSLNDDAPNRLLTSDPVVQRLADERGVDVETFANSDALDKDRTLTWEDLAWLREQTDLPVVLKGVVHPDDARLAVEHGADGVVVSTHGGRQIDGARAAVAALPEVAAAVDGEIPVLLDSGVRTGADAFKALALGADAVLVGRPFVFGLAIAGQRGVYEVLANVLAELDSVLGLSGHDDVAAVGREALVEE